MGASIAGVIVLIVLALATAHCIHRLVAASLRELLDSVLQLPPAAVFYGRLFAVGLVLIAVGEAIDTSFNLGEDPAFMEYVWAGAGGLSAVFGSLILYMVAYLFLVTLILLVLKRRHEQ
ncbi:hypothetical protein ACFLZR_00795 [Candidatus Neomarinimicrobiota bacterium]